MPTFDDLLTAVRNDSDHAVLAAAEDLRTAGRRRTVAHRSAATAVALLVIAGLTAVVAMVGTRTAPGPVVRRTAPPSPSRYAMVTGRVTINGKPAAGATVRVEAWPNESVLGQLKDGEGVPEFHVGQAVTGADGWYEVAIDPTEIPPNYYLSPDPDAAINVEFDVTVGGRGGLWNAPVQPCEPQTARYWCVDGVDGEAPLVLDFEGGNRPQVRDTGMGGDTWQEWTLG